MERRYRKNKETGRKEAKKKPRQIYFASHLDSHIYAYYASILQEKYEEQLRGQGFNDSILAYRSLAKTNIHYARDAFEAIRRLAPCTVLAMDLEQFFDSLNHGILKRRWAETLGTDHLPNDHYAVFKSLTRFSYCEQRAVKEVTRKVRRGHRWKYTTPEEFRSIIAGKNGTESLIKLHTDDEKHGARGEGIPQGSPISAVLANLYLYDFDRSVYDVVNQLGGKYFRYSDDLLYIIPGINVDEIENLIIEEINRVGLRIQPQKTERFHFLRDEKGKITLFDRKPLQYLGFTFDGKRVLLRDSSIKNYYRKLRKALRVQAWLDRRHPRKPKAGHRKFITKYSNRGKRNFIQYALKSSRIMNSKSIKYQVALSLEMIRSIFV